MRIATLNIQNFRGIRTGLLRFGQHPILIGDNNTGKTTVIEALTLILGRDRLIRDLTEHDFYGSTPQPTCRIKLIATITDFVGNDPDINNQWFRDGRAITQWFDESTGRVHPQQTNEEWKLCCQIAVQARFDAESLDVEMLRYFYDHDIPEDPFTDDAPQPVPSRLIKELSFYLVRASRTWDKAMSWSSELFKRAITAAASQPSSTLLFERDRLRAPEHPIETDPGIAPLIQNINRELGLSFPSSPSLQLRLTRTDSRSVMEAIAAHFEIGEHSVPASRQGSGLVSMQGLLLLLELARTHAENGGEFLMALEEPEVHLPPAAQQRLVHRIQALSAQTFVTTHSPLVASMAEPTSVLVLKKSNGELSAEPFLETPLPPTAPNWQRKFFQHSRVDVISALMQPNILVPEGRADFQLLRSILKPLAMTSEWGGSELKQFGMEVGVVPTEDAKVFETYELLSRLNINVCCLVDGDADGHRYVTNLLSSTRPPHCIIQWSEGAMIEDVIGWILDGEPASAMSKLAEQLPDSPTTVIEVVEYLKTKKMDIIAYEAVADAICTTEACRIRASNLLSDIACACTNSPSPTLFTLDSRGVWVFQV